MDEENRVQLGETLHALAQGDLITGGKLVDSARAHEGLESHHTALDHRRELVEVARDKASPKAEVDLRRTPHRGQLQVESLDGRRDRQVVQRHVDEARVAARGQRCRAVGDVLPVGSAGLVEVDVRVDAAGKDVQPRGVDLFAASCRIRTDLGDDPILDRDIRRTDPTRRDDSAAADDHCSARSSRNLPRTSIATPTSSVATDSAGLWLTPPLQRTNSMPMSVISDMYTPS